MELKNLYVKVEPRLIKQGNCWVWPGATIPKGYGHVSYKGHNYLVHRISYEFHKGSAEGLQVRHQCHNKVCCNPEHLLLGTNKENAQDDVRDGRRGGEKHGRAVITNEQAKRVKDFPTFFTNREISNIMKIPRYIVASIRQGANWKRIVSSSL